MKALERLGRVHWSAWVVALTIAPGLLHANAIVRLEIPGEIIVNNDAGIDKLSMGSSYSLHAGAIAGTARDIKHKPTQKGAALTTFPTIIGLETVSGKVTQHAIATRLDKAGKESDKGTPVPYASESPKPYNDGVTHTSETAIATSGVNPFVKGTIALAEAAVKFSTRKGKSNLTGKVNTFFQTTPQPSSFSITRVGGDNAAAQIGSLILDPLTFEAAAAGDQVIGRLLLTRDGFSVTIDEDRVVAAARAEAASNLPVSASPIGPLGTSYQDLSLIYTFDIAFQSGQLLNPDIDFQFDPVYQFFDPDDLSSTPSPLSTGSVESFVRNRILDHLVMNGSDTVSLDVSELVLFDFRGTAIGAQTDPLRVDYLTASAVEVSVPATILLIGIGGLGWIARRRCVNKPRSSD